MDKRTHRSLRGEAVFLDIAESSGGSLAIVFREAYGAPRLLITGCGGSASAVELNDYASDDDGFADGSVGRVTIREDGDDDVLQLRGVQDGAVRINYDGRFPKLHVGEQNRFCLDKGEHDHDD